MRKQLATLSAVGLIASAGLIGTVPAAHADEVPNAVTSVTTTGEAVKVGDVLTLAATWHVPDHSKAGDTFTLPLPVELAPLATDFNLTNAQGAVVATAHVQAGQVVVTLSDYVTDHPLNVGGNLNFSARVADSATPGKPITVNWGGKVVTITPEKGWDGTGNAVRIPWKGMWAGDGGAIGSQIDLPGAVDSATLTDTPRGMDIKCESLSVIIGDQSDGNYPTKWAAFKPAAVDCGTDHLNVTYGAVPANKIVHMTYYSTPKAGVKEVENDWRMETSKGTSGGTAKQLVYGAGGDGSGDGVPTPPPSEEPTPEPSEPPVTEDPTPAPSCDDEPSLPGGGDCETPEPTTPPTDKPSTPPATEEPTPEPSTPNEPIEEPTAPVTEEPTPAPTCDAPTDNPQTPVDDGCDLPPTGEPSVPGGDRENPVPPVTPEAPKKEEPSSKPTTDSPKPSESKSETSQRNGEKPASSTPDESASETSSAGTSKSSGGAAAHESTDQGSDDSGRPGAAGEALAYTGSNAYWIAPLAAGAVVLGIGFLLFGKRRKDNTTK